MENIPPLRGALKKEAAKSLEKARERIAEVRELLKAGEMEKAIELMNEFRDHIENIDNACEGARGRIMKFRGLAKAFEEATELDFAEFMGALSEQLGLQFETSQKTSNQPVLGFEKSKK
jgi:predicted RNase H-like HicB family nuclease